MTFFEWTVLGMNYWSEVAYLRLLAYMYITGALALHPGNRVIWFLERLHDTLTSDQLPSVESGIGSLRGSYT
jgi:hypothetical protein